MAYKPQLSDLIPIKAPVDPENPNYYVDKEAFNRALKDHKTACLIAEDAGQPNPPVSEYIGECIVNIAKGVGQLHNFRNYSYVKEMIGDSIYTCLRYIRSYDPDRLTSEGKPTSAFSYFTQTCKFSMIARITTEKKQDKVKRAIVMSADFDTFSLGEDDDSAEFQMHLNEFISSLGTDDTELDLKIEKANNAKPEEKKPGAFDSFEE